MSVASFLQVVRERVHRPSSDPSQKIRKQRKAIIELIIAARDMAERLTLPTDAGKVTECICGGTLAAHQNFCPVDRYYRAVDGVRNAVL